MRKCVVISRGESNMRELLIYLTLIVFTSYVSINSKGEDCWMFEEIVVSIMQICA